MCVLMTLPNGLHVYYVVILHSFHCAGKVRAFGTGPAAEVDSDEEVPSQCSVTVSSLSDLQDFDPLSCEDKPHIKLDLIKEILRGNSTT